MRGTANRVGLLVLFGMAVVGCSKSETTATSKPDAAYLLMEKPSDAVGVADARTSTAEEVAVEGRIGGSTEPFVKGVAAFTIVDPALAPCSKEEGCPTPWDYCCGGDKLETSTAMIKFVGADGSPVAKDARELLGVKELSRVIVQGKAQRDEQGNLTVLASKLHLVSE